MMIAPATELAHTDDEIAELEEQLEWLRWCKRLCVGGPVSLERREALVMSVAVGVAGATRPGCNCLLLS